MSNEIVSLKLKKRTAGETLTEFRRSLPRYRRVERCWAWDIVRGYWVAQHNEVLSLPAEVVRQAAIDLGLTGEEEQWKEGDAILLRMYCLAPDYLKYIDRIDLDRPILLAEFPRVDGTLAWGLLDGRHRIHKAYLQSAPLKALVLTRQQLPQIEFGVRRVLR